VVRRGAATVAGAGLREIDVRAERLRIHRGARQRAAPGTTSGECAMSKGMDQKKDQKKKPEKTMKEKKAEKQAKKAAKR
jgi:hypothetical protein